MSVKDDTCVQTRQQRDSGTSPRARPLLGHPTEDTKKVVGQHPQKASNHPMVDCTKYQAEFLVCTSTDQPLAESLEKGLKAPEKQTAAVAQDAPVSGSSSENRTDDDDLWTTTPTTAVFAGQFSSVAPTVDGFLNQLMYQRKSS